MQTSATGTSANKRPLRAPHFAARGFTLVEILVVMVIIGVIVAGALLSLGVLGRDRGIDTERDRLEALLSVVRDDAAMQGREFGLRLFVGGYEFVSYDPRAERWLAVSDDRTLRRREWPGGIEVALRVEGRPVVLPKPDAEDRAPQVMLYSNGEVGAFELSVVREQGGPGFRAQPVKDGDDIEFVALEAKSP